MSLNRACNDLIGYEFESWLGVSTFRGNGGWLVVKFGSLCMCLQILLSNVEFGSHVVINNHRNSQGTLKTTFKGSIYRELPSVLVIKIEKSPSPHAATLMI